MSVERTLSTVIGRPAHDRSTTTTRKTSVPTRTAARCLLGFTALSPRAVAPRRRHPSGRGERLRLIELEGGHVLLVAVERALLLREDPHVLPALHLCQHEAPVELVTPDVGGAEHALAAHRRGEVVDVLRLLEKTSSGQTVVAVLLDNFGDDVAEEQSRRPCLGGEAIGLVLSADRRQERVHGLVLLRLFERDE